MRQHRIRHPARGQFRGREMAGYPAMMYRRLAGLAQRSQIGQREHHPHPGIERAHGLCPTRHHRQPMQVGQPHLSGGGPQQRCHVGVGREGYLEAEAAQAGHVAERHRAASVTRRLRRGGVQEQRQQGAVVGPLYRRYGPAPAP